MSTTDDPASALEKYLEAYTAIFHDRDIDSTSLGYPMATARLKGRDLSRAVAAIRERDAEVARLTRERNALLVSLVSAAIRDDADTERVLDDHAGMAVTIRTAIQGVVDVGWEKYLDLPSDLEKTT